MTVTRKERLDAKRCELYSRMRVCYPELFRRAVQIGSLVTCQPRETTRLAIAAQVEAAVMSLVLEIKEAL